MLVPVDEICYNLCVCQGCFERKDVDALLRIAVVEDDASALTQLQQFLSRYQLGQYS